MTKEIKDMINLLAIKFQKNRIGLGKEDIEQELWVFYLETFSKKHNFSAAYIYASMRNYVSSICNPYMTKKEIAEKRKQKDDLYIKLPESEIILKIELEALSEDTQHVWDELREHNFQLECRRYGVQSLRRFIKKNKNKLNIKNTEKVIREIYQLFRIVYA